MNIKLVAIIVIALLPIPAAAKDKSTANLEWRTGTLLDQASEPRCRTSGHVYEGNGSVGTTCTTVTFYTIDAGEMTYTLSRGTFPREELLAVTVNAPIKFASNGEKWYIQDERGKPHEVHLFKKAMNNPKQTKD